MKRFFIVMAVVVSAMSMMVTDAEAKRLGGGGSFGKQSPSFSRQAPSQSYSSAPSQNQARPAQSPSTPQSIPPKPASPWKNILGGALLGLGLGALMSHFGLGGAFGSMIGGVLMIALLGVAAMFVYRLFMSKKGGSNEQPAYAGAYGSNYTPEIGSKLEPSAQPASRQADFAASGVNAQGGTPLNVPADFDAPAFLRNAKTYFIRLQAAWDKADINDIREFTTSEMFAELRLQLQERGASPNHTDVVSLNAELLGVETLNNEHMASVQFSGMIKEAENAPAESFAEIWNLTKPLTGQGGWVLAGIQQLSSAA